MKLLEGGQGMNTLAAQAQQGTADYAVVEDLAGQYLAETERLATLQARKREIMGAQAYDDEEADGRGFAAGPRKTYADGF